MNRDVYLMPILNNAPRLIGLLNRNISSKNYGCFDREFWHYNTVDIACARKQEGVLTLTLLYLIESEANKYYLDSEVLEHIKAALRFWSKIQNRNGSFNEWYPNEHSFVVTAFSAFAISESLLLLKNKIPSDVHALIVESLRKSGNWLIKRNETRVMNQQTGAAVALLNLYLLTDDKKYLDASKDKITLLNQRQSNEGWFIEYGGPDIGYLSLAIDYLSKYYLKTGDEQVKEMISRSLGFMKNFVQPNLIAGGEYTSRNTEYLIPHGFEIFSRFNQDAFFIASVVRKKLAADTDAFPYLFDDRYLTYVGYTWLQAYVDANQDLDDKVADTVNDHFRRSLTKYYEDSGLLVINDNRKHFVINVKKGGAFRMFDKKYNRAYSDSGILTVSRGQWYTSGWLSENGQHEISRDTITVLGTMWKVPDRVLNTPRYVLFRLFQITLGRSNIISLWLKERLRDILITKTKLSSMTYKRVFKMKEDSTDLMEVVDSVVSPKAEITTISVFAKDTQIYVPSSRYFTGRNAPGYQKNFPHPVSKVEVKWKIGGDEPIEFIVN